jgi:hypothetical protein
MFRWSSARSDALLESPQALLSTVTTMGYFGFLAGPPFSSPQAPIDRDAPPALRGDLAPTWHLQRHERHDFRKHRTGLLLVPGHARFLVRSF